MRGIVVESIRNSLTTANYSFAQLAMQKIANRVHGNKIISLSRYKNFCVFSGRSRTYNRSLYMARHNMRKFVGAGLISGLLK
jgi:ribosomal protein S14